VLRDWTSHQFKPSHYPTSKGVWPQALRTTVSSVARPPKHDRLVVKVRFWWYSGRWRSGSSAARTALELPEPDGSVWFLIYCRVSCVSHFLLMKAAKKSLVMSKPADSHISWPPRANSWSLTFLTWTASDACAVLSYSMPITSSSWDRVRNDLGWIGDWWIKR